VISAIGASSPLTATPSQTPGVRVRFAGDEAVATMAQAIRLPAEGCTMPHKKLSRNAPCPCGSGKKYKHCCHGKGVEDDLGLRSGRPQPQCPTGTAALYAPDDKTTTKIAAGVILHDGAEPILKRWVATDVTTSPKVQQEMKDFFLQHGVKQVAMT